MVGDSSRCTIVIAVGGAYCYPLVDFVHCCCTRWFYLFLVDSASSRATN